MTTSRHSITVTLLEGRYFSKSKNLLYVQTNFNNEILTTDPIPQTSSPIFDTELCWFVTHKQLSFLKSQRQKLKLVVYSLENQERIMLGYVILDLRSAEENVNEKWFKLVNLKSDQFLRPELKLGFSVSPERSGVNFNNGEQIGYGNNYYNDAVSNTDYSYRANTDAEARSRTLSDRKTTDATQTINIVDDATQTINRFPDSTKTVNLPQRAPSNNNKSLRLQSHITDIKSTIKQTFILSITISFIQNSDLDSTFEYEFLQTKIKSQSNKCTTDTFYIETTILELHDLFRKDIKVTFGDGLRVFYIDLMGLCFGDNYERVYPVYLNGNLEKIGPNVVGVGVCLSLTTDTSKIRSEQVESDVRVHHVSELVKIIDSQVLETNNIHVLNNTNVTKTENVDVLNNTNVKTIENVDILQNTTIKQSNTDYMNNQSNTNFAKETINTLNSNTRQFNPNIQSNTRETKKLRIDDEDSESSDSEEWHQYRVSIALLTLSPSSVLPPKLFLKYNHKPFSTKNIQTEPKLRSDSIVIGGFDSFEFMMTKSLLEEYLEEIKLRIELWGIDQKKFKVGECGVYLGELVSVNVAIIDDAVVHSITVTQPIVALDGIEAGNNEKEFSTLPSTLATLQLQVTLQDFGPIEDYQKFQAKPILDYNNILKTDYENKEYEITIELELWKQQQKQIFLKELEDLKETQRIENEQEAKVQQLKVDEKLKEYTNMIEDLEKTTLSLETREKQITLIEQNLEKQAFENKFYIQNLKSETQRLEQKLLNETNDLKAFYEKQGSENTLLIQSLQKEMLELRDFNTKKEYESFEIREIRLKTELENENLKNQNQSLEQRLKSLMESRHSLKKKYLKLYNIYVQSELHKKQPLEKAKPNSSENKENLGQQNQNVVHQDRENLVELRQEVLRKKEILGNNGKEIKRLEGEVESLLKSGYLETDGLIMDMKYRINELKV